MKLDPSTRVHTLHRVIRQTLVITLGGRRRVLSSAPQGGGFKVASAILNHQVAADSGHHRHLSDPARYLRKLSTRLGISTDTVGLMTAVPMTQLVTARAALNGLWVECFATVGVTNAVRAGEWPISHDDQYRATGPGTINLILITNGSLSSSAMVGAVQVATEAKTAVLHKHAILSERGKALATGTGTDAVVIACRLRGQGPPRIYSGTHTLLGAMVGHVVTTCVTQGLAKAKAWQESHE